MSRLLEDDNFHARAGVSFAFLYPRKTRNFSHCIMVCPFEVHLPKQSHNPLLVPVFPHFQFQFSLLILDINLTRNVQCTQLARASRGVQWLQALESVLWSGELIFSEDFSLSQNKILQALRLNKDYAK